MRDKPAGKAAGYFQSPEALRRLKRRRRAEARLRAYGIAAIAIAALALVALLSSVISKAGGAVTESYLTLPVRLDAKVIDPEGTKDPAVIRRADFAKLVKRALRERFGAVKGRKAKRALYGLVSTGASFDLARHVAANPDLIGREIRFDLLASDIADLYLKGAYGELEEIPVKGDLAITADGKEMVLQARPEDFAAALQVVRAGLLREAARLTRRAAREESAVAVFKSRAEAAQDAALRAESEAEAARHEALREKYLAGARDLEARAAGGEAAETLDEDAPSLFIAAAGGWLRLTAIGPESARAIPYAPLGGMTGGEIRLGPGEWRLMVNPLPEGARKVSDRQIVWLEQLRGAGAVKQVLNTRFLTASDSREPELAGIRGAIMGSFWLMLVTFALAFPVGVFGAIYLEEFAPKNRLTALIEISINNLAAVPSIVFGLLGLALFLGVFGVPRSSPLAGGIVLALMTLPTIIIAARAALRAVPPSIREAALGVGASRLQATFHHVLPLAMPGILTGTIIGMAQALGETAPLILIGMVAFIVDVPQGITDSATALPVQIYRWSDFPERAFEARTAAAILVLLLFLVVMNGLAILLRKRFERRW